MKISMPRALLIFLAALASAQSPDKPKERDLKLEKTPPPVVAQPGPATAPVTGITVPRSYALVVGISTFRDLPPEGQLRFPERDAESMYTVLISAEGGQFPAQN